MIVSIKNNYIFKNGYICNNYTENNLKNKSHIKKEEEMMKIAVRYYSKTGNTKKLAEAIGRAIGVKAFPLSQPVDPDTDILFLGSSVYAAGVSGEVKTFINTLDKNVGKVVNFSSAAIIESTYNQVKKLVKNRGITMSDKEFHCRGSFTVMHRGKPDKDDLKSVATFAKEVTNG